MIPFLDLKAQYASIRSEVDQAIARVVHDCQFVLGPEVEAFEREFADYCQARHAVGTSNGTTALHLALLAAGVKAGDEVITASHTFIATAAAVRHAGAKPVLVDIDARSCTIDPRLIEAAITPRTRALLPVHLYGQCADMDPILEIARRHRLIVIEDAAQAHGAMYKGRRAGSMGDLACFSFYPGKNLGAYGEGGAVVTRDEAHAQTVRILRDQGQSRKYHHVLVGFNARLEGIQAAVLRVKLRHLDHWNEARRAHAAAYQSRLADAGVRVLTEMTWGTPVWHIFPVFTPARDALQVHLQTEGISTGIHYPVPVHLQPAFSDLALPAGSLPETERAASETLSLPMYAELKQDMIDAVARSVRSFRDTARPSGAKVR